MRKSSQLFHGTLTSSIAVVLAIIVGVGALLLRGIQIDSLSIGQLTID